MFKNIIAPVQAWLLSQDRCVGCGTGLKNGRKDIKEKNQSRVICKKCARVYLYDAAKGKFQRAPLS